MKVQSISPKIEQPYCWLFARNEQLIGVHQTNGWCTQLRDEKSLFFDREEKCVLLMILLELKTGEFEQHLTDAAILAPEYAGSIQRFPRSMLLRHVFHSSYSDYWPDKALNWLDEQPALLPLLAAELEHVFTHRVMSQSLRHRARRMYRNHALADADTESSSAAKLAVFRGG